MNVLAFAFAVFVIQPLVIALGLAGFALRPGHPRAGLAMGILSVLLAVTGLLVTDLWQFRVAAVAGAVTGVAAILRPGLGRAGRWLAVGGGVAWCVAMILLLLDAG